MDSFVANETSYSLALAQTAVAEVVFYRRIVQQPVQCATTVVAFAIKMFV
jgi:hypothetical protein